MSGSTATSAIALEKANTGIRGLDDITGGGLPRGRPTLVCGGPGCGKTLLAAEFLVRGATEFDEPGVFMAFEETAADLAANVASLGFELDRLVAEGKLRIDHVRVERSEIEEAGDYDLEGLFVRLDYAISAIGAKRVVIDTIESLFSGFSNEALLRAELRRLFHWLKQKGVTAIITGERGNGTLTRQGLEEYVSDCVISLDHRVTGEISTRRLRIVKYRGSSHGTNEYPFLIDSSGFSVIPITAAALDHPASDERVSTGIAGLDAMLGGRGYFRGSSVLLSGTAGSGKTTTAAHMIDAACRRGERALYFAFEESPAQIERNMKSVGINLRQWRERGLLRTEAARPALFGLEAHLARMLHMVQSFEPDFVVVDPVTALLAGSVEGEVRAMVLRMIDMIKRNSTTLVMTALVAPGEARAQEETDVGISSIVDSWILLRDVETNGERNRLIYVLKSRGMAHSNQLREFLITSEGVELVPAYLGPDGILTGSARLQQAARAEVTEAQRAEEFERKRRRLAHRRMAVEAQIEALRAELEAESAEFDDELAAEHRYAQHATRSAREIAASRHAGSTAGQPNGRAASERNVAERSAT